MWARVGAIGALGVAAIGLVDLVGAPTGAQSVEVKAALVSADAAGSALSGTNTNPSVSDAGDVVVFTNRTAVQVAGQAGVEADSFEYDLVVRKRSAGVDPDAVLLVDVNSDQSIAAALSGNGCTLAYSTMVQRPVDEPVGDPAAEDPAAEDPAAEDPAAEDPAAEDVPADSPADDPDAEAAEPLHPEVIELRTLDLCGAPGIAPERTVLDRVEGTTPLPAPAVSTDGTRIAWPVGSAIAAYSDASTPDVPDVIEIPAPGADLLVGDHLDITSDGSIIVFEAGPLTIDPDDPADAIVPSVYISTITTPALVTDPAVVATKLFAPSDAGSSWPTISGDGTIVIYHSDAPLPIEAAPADGDYLVLASRTVAPVTHRVLTTGAVRPDLATGGAALVYDVADSVQVRRSDSAVPFEESTERIANPKIGVAFQEGAAASVTGAVVSADGGVVVFDQPANVQLSTPLLVDAHVWLQEAAPLFAPPPTSTTIATTTTTTTIAPTVPTVSVATTTQGTPQTVPRNTTRTTTSNTTRTTTRTTTRPTTANTTVTTTPSLPVAFDPAAFEFAPTIINAGRRTATVDLFNPTADAVAVASVVADAAGAADFVVDPSACTTLAPGARCTVGITFAPTVIGELTANVIATLGDGSSAAVALRGIGAPEPTLSVQPGVASNGQVVTVFGSGFPAGASVAFDWNDGQVLSTILVDEVGGFAETLIVLPNTATGPTPIAVAGQVDLFGDVTASVLVSGSSSRNNTALLGGAIAGGTRGR